MAGNSIGKLFRLTSFGESHGDAVGGVVDGCPSGLELSIEKIQYELNRRRPANTKFTTARDEEDRVEIVSGLFEGITTGMPIGFLVYNRDQQEKDYAELRSIYRPSHADYTWEYKYGVRDYRGGGRSSAREHIARVVAGAIAKQWLAQKGISFYAYTSGIGALNLDRDFSFQGCRESTLRCPDPVLEKEMEGLIIKVREEGDSIGGVVSCLIKGVPIGIGEPVFDRLQARLAHAMMSINAAKGFEYGEGFYAASMRGSEHNDSFIIKEGEICTATNHSGGVQGGVSNGEDIYFRVAFKPIPTISIEQQSVTTDREAISFITEGRHDPCVIPRVIPVVEAMAAIVIMDLMLEFGASGEI